MNDEQRCELLKEEYLQLHKAIEEFDGRALTIKAWSVTFSLTALIGAFAAHAPAVFLVACLGSCLFWLIECMWKTFQYAFYERMNQIEDYFAGKSPGPPAPLQIGRVWYERWSRLGPAKRLRILLWPPRRAAPRRGRRGRGGPVPASSRRAARGMSPPTPRPP